MKTTVGIPRRIRAGQTMGTIMNMGLPGIVPIETVLKASGQGLAGIFKGRFSTFFEMGS